jgi:hypothetical protein
LVIKALDPDPDLINLDPKHCLFHNFITCSRRRKAGSALCRCSGSSSASTKAESVCYAGVQHHPPAAPSGLELKLPGGVVEVYDNPNYSHILIGGQPFFILPSGELSGHVPVPSQGERLSPLHRHGQQQQQQQLQQQQQQQHHIYAGQGSSTYRSGYNTVSLVQNILVPIPMTPRAMHTLSLLHSLDLLVY